MMASPLSKYAFINAKLRARISNILPETTFGQLAKAASLDAALALLRQTPFARLEAIYSETGDMKQAELELLKEEIGLYKNIQKHLHEDSRPTVNALLYHFEIDNLKNAIRIYFNRKVGARSDESAVHYVVYEPIIHNIPIDLIINAQRFDEIAGLCEGTPYAQIIRKYYHTVESEGSLFRLEIALDHFYYGNLVSTINGLGSKDRDIALRLVGVEIDLQNISWVIRFRSFYDLPLEQVLAAVIPGGFGVNKAAIDELYRAQNVTAVLQRFVKDKYPGLSALLSSQTSDSTSRLLLISRILEEIRNQEVAGILAGYPFTIGIILAYFMLKNAELKRLRMILNAKQYGKPAERIGGAL